MSAGGTAGGRITAGVGANLIGQHAQDRNQDATVYVGNLDAQMTEELVWELFTQAGPVVNVYLPKDRVTNQHMGYGFVEFRSEEDADYSIKVLNMIKIFGKPIRVNKASQDKRSQDVGANLFIGNLDPEVDEKLLYDTFSAFGMIVATPKIMRDPDTGLSKGFGFVSYETFEASDAAIEAMHNQFLCNRPITVGYAFKKDTKGERHGTPAERLLAEQQRNKAAAQSRPNTLFAVGPRQVPEASMLENGGVPPPPPMGGIPPPPPQGAMAPWGAMPPAAPQWAQQGAPRPPAPWARPPQMGGAPPPWMGQQRPPPPPWMAQGGPPRPPFGYGPPPGSGPPQGIPPPPFQQRPPFPPQQFQQSPPVPGS